MNKDETFKLPRLYTTHKLHKQGVIALKSTQAHYLFNVMRRKEGDRIRLFNGLDGEWLGALQNINKKNGTVTLTEQLVAQPANARQIHFIFSPIKKNRQDWMIEKAVELGVSQFHPIITQNTEVRKINAERMTQQIFEAAEQCERFDIPTLKPTIKLQKFLGDWPADMQLLACLERFDTTPIEEIKIEDKKDIAFLIGPEGGFTSDEKELLARHAKPIGLGKTILRCETAALKALIILNR